MELLDNWISGGSSFIIIIIGQAGVAVSPPLTGEIKCDVNIQLLMEFNNKPDFDKNI